MAPQFQGRFSPKSFTLPPGKRLAFYAVLNIEWFPEDHPQSEGAALAPHPDVMNIARREYGAKVGVWRLREIFDQLEIPVTAALNTRVIEAYPEIMDAGVESGWEWAGHGKTNARRVTTMSREDEREELQDVADAIESRVGKRPSGWLGPGLAESTNTLELLSELNYQYVMDWCVDDQPSGYQTERGELIAMPYSQEVNDYQAFFLWNLTGSEYAAMVTDQFDQLYRECHRTPRVMALPLHPFISGVAYRSVHVRRAVEYIRSFDDVWFAQGSQIAESVVRD